MKRFILFLLTIAGLLSGRASGTWNQFLTVETDTAEYVTPKDTTVYFPPVDTTHYEPVDTGEVVIPDRPSKPVIYVPTIHEGDNVTEFPHNPAVDNILSSEKPAKQEFTMTIEGEYLRIKGTLMARGYGKHYIHCQIIGDSVHLQRFDMDPESTDMILHNVDIRIPGFTEDYYKVTLAEQNDVPLYKQYMIMAKAVTRSERKPVPVIEEGKEWTIHSQVVYPYAPLIIHKTRIEGDTIVNGKTCKRLHCKTINEYGEERESFEYCYQEGEVFYRNSEKMFDFGLQVGDTFHVDRTEVLAVTEVSTIILNDDVSRKCLSMGIWVSDSEITPAMDKWIEGIGSLEMGIYDNSILRVGVKKELQSVISKNEYIYRKEVKSEYPYTPVVIKGCPTLKNPSTDDKIEFAIELGVFLGNDTYKQQLDSIAGNTIYTSGTYNRYWPGIATFNQTKTLTLGKLKEGDYTLHHNIRGLNGSAPTNIDTIFTYTFTVVDPKQIKSLTRQDLQIRSTSSSLLCTAPNAVKLEVYTMDAVKVGEAKFVNGEATVKVGEAPAMYLYIVTYSDGRRESGKIKN